MSTSNLQPNTQFNTSKVPYIKTSLIEVTNRLPHKPPCRVFFKNESEQPSGSFKLRGIGYLVKQSIDKAKADGVSSNDIHVFASSGGNAGLAAAYSAQFYNVKCTVVIPTIAKPIIQQKLKDYGARVILFGNSIYEADNYLKTLIESAPEGIHPIYCHPFNNPDIWTGHSSLVDEVNQQLGPNRKHLKSMVCSFGGGGLYNGIYQGMRNNKLQGDILLIETAQAPTLSESIKAKSIITLENVSSLATSLACSYTTQQSLDYFHDKSVGIDTFLDVIDDLDALRACVAYKRCCGKTVEPACGAALSACYDRIDLLYKTLSHLQEDDILVIVVCGGSCTTDSDLKQYEMAIKKAETKL
ncbi:Cha1 protein [Candida orthopsilosis Co 90-125]|uniref:L-serine ammonia-lyase n=1 Tax=Candida orthopsilosis (strain 90-125) TaxID=1136231 RepID=H8WXN6_CANO9|nr:Cha1 protein [Candida orthopsilosis Co 90-125]CCG21709.1 Cha1 protein [Candida orthopsilosis Co 90-125]